MNTVTMDTGFLHSQQPNHIVGIYQSVPHKGWKSTHMLFPRLRIYDLAGVSMHLISFATEGGLAGSQTKILRTITK